MDRIRVGLIRCDLHGIYYANVIQEHDPYVLREPEYGLGGYFYFYSQYNDPRAMSIPQVPGFELVKVWDADRRLAENMVKIYRSRPQICDRLEDVSEDVDLVLIADCNGDGADHLSLATPGIERGIPTFVDKPFAYDVRDARAIVDLAQRHGTPVMSLSILREVPHATRFRDRFGELGGPKFGLIKGGTHHMAGLIHAISLAQHLFGAGVESVEAMGGDPPPSVETGRQHMDMAEWIEVTGGNPMPFIVHLHYGGSPDRPGSGVVLNCDVGPTPHCAMYASAYSEAGAIHTDHIGDYEFPWGVIGIVEKVKRMVETHQPQVSYAEMIECIAIATAARLSQRERRRVYLAETVL